MSSAGAPGGAAATQLYFCHQCNRTAAMSPTPDGDIFCPFCGGGFVEELDTPDPNPNPNPTHFPMFAFQGPFDSLFPPSGVAPARAPFFFSPGAAAYDLRNPGDLAGLLGPDLFRPPAFVPAADPEAFNPLAFLQNHLQSLISGGANIQVVLEGGGGGNLGDYFVGPGLEQLIQQLAENDPNRYGTPPASKSSVKSLPDISVTDNLLLDECAVCKDAFELGADAKQMPCKHIYHKDCILPWLELHNSCPVCRYELPTDDPDYEQRGSGGAAQGGGTVRGGQPGGGSREGNESPGPRMVERRFRISLPWSFRSFTQAGASNAGDGANSGDGQGGQNADSGGQGGTGSEARPPGDFH